MKTTLTSTADRLALSSLLLFAAAFCLVMYALSLPPLSSQTMYALPVMLLGLWGYHTRRVSLVLRQAAGE